MARRRRGLRWLKPVLWGLGGLAAASIIGAAYYNPVPFLGALGAMVALYYLPGTIYRKAAELFEPRIGSPNDWARDAFGYADVYIDFDAYVDDRCSGDRRAAFRKIQAKLEEIRTHYVPVDGSDKRPDFNRSFNPMDLPMWLRLALLPDLCGLNMPGVRRWQLYGVTPHTRGEPPRGPFIEPEDSDSDKAYLQMLHDERVEEWRNKPYGYDFPETKITYEARSLAPELIRWEKAYPQIRALLGFDVRFVYCDDSGCVTLRPLGDDDDDEPGKFVDVTAVQLQEYEAAAAADALAELPYVPLPFVHQVHPAGHLADGYLFFGEQYLDAAKGGHWLAIDKLTHFLVMGTSGFGKSVFLNQILQGVRHNIERFDAVLLVDLKGGVELWPYQQLGEKFRVVYRLEDLPGLMAELVAAIEGRLEQMRERGLRDWPGRKTLLVIDEYAQIQLSPETTKEERQAKQAMLADLNKISMLGRAAGVLIWAQLQKGTTDVMDSSFRANLASQVCFKVPNKLTAAGMFGSTEELLVDPVKLPKGRFVLFDASNAETHYLQARVIGT